jgi:hypothetical protein
MAPSQTEVRDRIEARLDRAWIALFGAEQMADAANMDSFAQDIHLLRNALTQLVDHSITGRSGSAVRRMFPSEAAPAHQPEIPFSGTDTSPLENG